jgi:hypothetical protein
LFLAGDLGFFVLGGLSAGTAEFLQLELLYDELLVLITVIIGAFACAAFKAQ